MNREKTSEQVWNEAVAEGRNKDLISKLEELKWTKHVMSETYGLEGHMVEVINKLCLQSNHAGIDDAIKLIKTIEL